MPETKIIALVSYPHWARNEIDPGRPINQNAGAKLKRRRFRMNKRLLGLVSYLLHRDGNLTETINAR
jgi:hypothetical protein